jgi:hypothetical protein
MEVVMEGNVANQNEAIPQIIRFAPYTSRPHSLPQTPWQGPLPQGVKEVLTRDALAQHYRERYSKWASNFALLTDEFLAQVFEDEMSRIKQLVREEWTGFDLCGWHHCKVGEDYLWVQKQDGGWTIELCYPDNADPDARILTIENMPVLCPDALWAARVALACYPNPPANLIWHSYW